MYLRTRLKEIGHTHTSFAKYLKVSYKTVQRWSRDNKLPHTINIILNNLELEKSREGDKPLPGGPVAKGTEVLFNFSSGTFKDNPTAPDTPSEKVFFPGGYFCICSTCKKQYNGAKRSHTCSECADRVFDRHKGPIDDVR